MRRPMAFRSMLALGLICANAGALAQSEMSVAGFLHRAERAQSYGRMAALSSPDYRVLRSEVQRVARIYTAEVQAARAAGRMPPACMPSNPDLTPDDLLEFMRRIPPQNRARVSVRTAIYAMLRQRYPCRTR